MAKTVKLNTYKQSGEASSTINANAEVFGIETNNDVMFDAVMVSRANARQATAKTKKRDEVAGSGKKPYRQKGTGRARAGSKRSPIWVGGGTVFGPTGEQSFKLKQNKKEHNLALRSALSTLGKKNIYVLEELTINGQTKEIINLLSGLKLADKKVLLVSEDDLVLRASKNLNKVVTRASNNISVYDLLNCEALILNKEAVNDLNKLAEVSE